MKENFDEFPKRLKKVIGSESVNSFAKKCEVSESLLRKYLSGSLPGTKALIAIARAANVNIEWLATGEGNMVCQKVIYSKDIKKLSERILVALTKMGWLDRPKRDEIANKLCLHINQLENFIQGLEEPTHNQLMEIARLSGTRLQWLIEGIEPDEPMRKEDNRPMVKEQPAFKITNLEGREVEFRPSPELRHIPLLTAEAACGSGSLISSEFIKAVFSATESWFRRELGANPDNLSLIQARGDSMADTILPEEMVFVDRSHATEPGDGIWVFRYEEGLFIKRLQFLPGKKIKVKSDNPLYETYELKPDEHFSLLGRVIAALPLRRL